MIRYYQVELPAKVKAFTTCRDGDYSIVVNAILSREQQLEEIRHELQHIAGNDLYSGQPADNIESMIRKEG